MKRILILLVLTFSIQSFSQKITDTLISKKLNEDREITIVLPESYAKNKTKKYPLVVLLDGDYLLEPFQGALNYGAYWDDLPEVIIVAISQNKKDERATDCVWDQTSGLPMDKGEEFFEFIGAEIIPYIEKKYRVTPFKIIAGHDITAGFLNFFLYKEHPLFNGYISLSPEFPTGMEEEIPTRLSKIEKPIFYYHATADGDLKDIQAKAKKLDDAMTTVKKPTLNYQFDSFKGTSHYSLVLRAIPNALYQFFAIYQPISINEFNEKIVTLPSGYSEYLDKKYQAIESNFDIKKPIRLNDFRAIEAAILKNKDYNDFDGLAILADKWYPKSMLSEYELAMMYEKKGDNKNAVKHYLAGQQKEPIGNLTKNMMFEKADALKKTLPKKGKAAPVEEIPVEQTPEQTPEQVPTEKKTE